MKDEGQHPFELRSLRIPTGAGRSIREGQHQPCERTEAHIGVRSAIYAEIYYPYMYISVMYLLRYRTCMSISLIYMSHISLIMTSFREAMAKLGAGVDNELGGSAPHQCR